MLLRLCGAACLIFTLGPAWTFADESLFDASRIAEIPQRLQKFVDDGRISGAVTLVATQDRILHSAVVGQADLAAQRPMAEDSIFRIASLTKTITAAGLMLLVAEGKVAIDDPVAKYIPEFTDQKLKDGSAARPVTIRDVMTHTAGLAQPDRERSSRQTLAEMAADVGRAPLAFAPGSQWQYSSGLTVAGRVIEVVSGQEFSQFLRTRIFSPLQMHDTTFVLSPAQARRLAVTYQPGKNAGELLPVEIPDPTQPRTPNPSGGLFSTAGDLARFYQAVLQDLTATSPRLLPAALARQMVSPLTPGIVTGFTPGNAWGLGWCIVEQPQGVTRHLFSGTFGHGGAWGTQAWVDQKRGLILILMIQRSGFGNSDGSDVRDAFNNAVLSAYRGPTAEHAQRGPYGRYGDIVTMTSGTATARLCAEAGGRVLEFSRSGQQGLFLEPAELDAQAMGTPPMSAGRFDVGPELTIAPHPLLWSGRWTTEITGPTAARMVSGHDPATGLQLLRDVELTATESAARLTCRQTMANVSAEPRECCHWGRSFSPGGGICVIPLSGRSRFPAKYAMYEDSAIINVRNTDPLIREREGFLEILSPPRKPKLGFDTTAGWLAYLRPDNTLFVKRFPTFPERVYGEAASLTLSVWYPSGPRIELEPIGPREILAPGTQATFTEDWWLTEYPFPAADQKIDLTHLRSVVDDLFAIP